MMAAPADTIAAIATPLGRGGIGVVRVSGPKTRDIAQAIIHAVPIPRAARYSKFHGADDVLDEGIALYFPAPHSFTGEDVLELQGHGGAVVLDLVLQRVLQCGARPARPGEFSERAFINGKLDLAQAEAIADLIDSGSALSARAAMRSLRGAFSQRVDAIVEELIATRVFVEASIDFPEEDIEFVAQAKIRQRLEGLHAALTHLRALGEQGRVLRDGMSVAILGRPNAGKSSLLNALATRDAAIVSAVPGTTRDIIREHIAVDGVPLHVLDTAGLRDSPDAIEREGVRRALAAAREADIVLLLIDDSASDGAPNLGDLLPHFLVYNKIDISGRNAGAIGDHEIAVSALTGAGIDNLRHALRRRCLGSDIVSGEFTARRRHVDAIDRGRGYIESAIVRLGDGALELGAEDLRHAQAALGEITGVVTSEELLGRIFSSFCIGK